MFLYLHASGVLDRPHPLSDGLDHLLHLRHQGRPQQLRGLGHGVGVGLTPQGPVECGLGLVPNVPGWVLGFVPHGVVGVGVHAAPVATRPTARSVPATSRFMIPPVSAGYFPAHYYYCISIVNSQANHDHPFG